jgi:2-phosphoglycerate kinase
VRTDPAGTAASDAAAPAPGLDADSPAPSPPPSWEVLLLGGHSGAGKSTVAERLARRYGTAWLMVDDLRLALQRSRAVLPSPAATAALRFTATPGWWRQPPERLLEVAIADGRALSPALEVVIENHIDQRLPVVLEGDGILPELLARPSVATRAAGGRVRAVFVVEPDETALAAAIQARGREATFMTAAEVAGVVRARWRYGRWLTEQAHHADLPVLAPRPWATLADRIAAATTAGDAAAGNR